MAENLFVTATEAGSGKSAVSLGVMEMLCRRLGRVGFFRPFINGNTVGGGVDADLELIASCFDLDLSYDAMYGYTGAEARHLAAAGREDEILEGILTKYNQLEEHCDFVLCEGTDFVSASAAFEYDINAEVSLNLGAPVLLVAAAAGRPLGDVVSAVDMALRSLGDRGCQTIGLVLNRVTPAQEETLREEVRRLHSFGDKLLYAIPEDHILGKPTVREIARALGADLLWGEEELGGHAHSVMVAAMQVPNFLARLEHGALVITPGDRADVIIATLAAASSSSMVRIAGIVLTGGLVPEEPVWKLIRGFRCKVPILSVKENTFPTASRVERTQGVIRPEDGRKVAAALALFERHVRVDELSERIVTSRAASVTPKMFEFRLLEQAKAQRQHIVLPEGEEERILRAAEILLRREVVDLTLLGREERIQDAVGRLGLELNGVRIVDPASSDRLETYVQTYYALRKHKGITLENARDVLSDVSYFGTMMVQLGDADGMVSGSIHTTAETIRPAFEIIRAKEGFSVVSSIFLMCLADRVLVYGDCAINPNPDAAQLAEIALSSAETARTFGVDPRVAMLSYSTGVSGKGEDVERVREATRLARERAREVFPGLLIEGPIQYDAAVDPAVARTKMPDSEVAGRATVLIFPDLNTGNNTYKAVQRSAGAVAIGPILQGLKRPVNDLSRGCTVADIVNTVAITAIQARCEKEHP